MAAASRPATPAPSRAVASLAEIESAADELRLVLRQARAIAGKITPAGDEDSDPERIAKGMLYSPRFQGLPHIVTLLFDMVDRGIPLEHLDAVGETITALVHKYAERRRGLKSDQRSLALVSADVTEELSEGMVALAQAVAEPTPANLYTAERELAEAETMALHGREIITQRRVS